MIIKAITAGPFQVNNYLIICEDTKEAALIDAGGDFKKTEKLIKDNNVSLKYLFNTHGHLDHVAGDFEIREKLGTKVFLHKEDQFMVDSFQQFLGLYGFPHYETPIIDDYFENNQEIKVGNLNFKVLHTPGHSPGSVSLLVNDSLFAGDTIFARSVGRTDLPGGSYEVLKSSIEDVIFSLNPDITIYPGHGETTTVGEEKLHNPFFGRNFNR